VVLNQHQQDIEGLGRQRDGLALSQQQSPADINSETVEIIKPLL